MSSLTNVMFPTKRLNPVAGRATFETRFQHSIQDPFTKLSDFVATTWQKPEKKIAETLSG